MGDQLASLEASLQASDKQAGSLQQELASLGNAGPDPPSMKVTNRSCCEANIPLAISAWTLACSSVVQSKS